MPEIIQKVVAQAEPTFPYDGPFDPGGPTPPTEEVTALLSSDTSSFAVGQTATCDLRIESNTEDVQEYTISIAFDPDVLEVVDADAVTVGVQVNFLDTFATVQSNDVDNDTGVITLVASISGAAQTINRDVAQITFRAKNAGTSVVSINKSQSIIVNDAGSDVLGATTSLNFTVSGQTQTTTTSTLPASGITDTIATFGSVLTGFFLLYVGIKTIIDRKRDKELDL